MPLSLHCYRFQLHLGLSCVLNAIAIGAGGEKRNPRGFLYTSRLRQVEYLQVFWQSSWPTEKEKQVFPPSSPWLQTDNC